LHQSLTFEALCLKQWDILLLNKTLCV